MARRTTEPKPTAADSLERARAAAARAQSKLDKKGRTSGEDEWDFRHAPLSEWRERWHDPAIRRLFIENFIYIRDENDQKKLVLLKFNDMQDDYYGRRTRQNVVLKMRKGGSSSIHLAIKVANAVVMPGRTVHIVAHNPKTEAKFRRDVRTMYRMLPPHLKPKSQKTDTGGLEFQDAEKGTVDSVIIVYGVQPGFEDSARGDTVTDVLITEMPSMRGDVRLALTAIMEACATDAEVDVESTAKGIEVFHSIFQEGKHRRGGWSAHFYEWWWRRSCRSAGAGFLRVGGEWVIFDPAEPDAKRNLEPVTSAERKVAARILLHLIRRGYIRRGAKWYAPEVAEYIAWRRFKIEQRSEKTFLVEYPENDKDCFEQTGRPVIRADYLKVTCDPSEPLEGHEYLVIVDTSAGTERGNPAAIQVIDIWQMGQVFEEKLKLPPDLLAYRVGEVSDLYNGGRIVPERNNTGYATIVTLKALGYGERIYKHLDAPTRRALEQNKLALNEAYEKAQYGFPTDAQNKPLAGLALEEMVRKRELGLSSQAFCDQALTVVWNDSGSFAALPGYEDDLFMALAIGAYVLRMEMGSFTGFVGDMPEVGFAR
ncbi:MAG TPA: hypothetical protein VF659_09325 [Pyrinomonadaceae bacterium]|jgi:hypothetical protein